MNKPVKINRLAAQLLSEATPPGHHNEWRRKDKRRRTGVALELQTESGEHLLLYTLNVTPVSMCLTSKTKLNVNKSVQVRRAHTDEPWSSAVVVHCTSTIGGYRIGLQMC